MKKECQMLHKCTSPWKIVLLCGLAAVMVGCSSGKRQPAPVEDRGAGAPVAMGAPGVNSAPPASTALPALPGAENAGQPGYYTVRPGDTLIRIGLEHGQNWRDLVRWNTLPNPNALEVGQVLRISPPVPVAVAAAPAASGVVVRPVPAGSAVPVTPASGGAAPAASAPVPATAAAGSPAAAPSVAAAEDELGWIWPVPGNVLAGYDESKNKGIDLNGRAGESVLASADGRVVYAGSGLRGYGNLIILKHNNVFLSAYAHNQVLLVKEDQTVAKGQKIAEMGSTDSDRVKLHFEIRRQGKPVDPMKYLPSR